MAKKTSTKRHSNADLIKTVQKLKPGFDVFRSEIRPSNSAATDAARSRKSYKSVQVVQTPDLLTLKKKYGLTGTDAVPNGIDATSKVLKTTKSTNQVFEVRPKNAGSDKPGQSKMLIVSKYTGRPVSAQG